MKRLQDATYKKHLLSFWKDGNLVVGRAQHFVQKLGWTDVEVVRGTSKVAVLASLKDYIDKRQ